MNRATSIFAILPPHRILARNLQVIPSRFRDVLADAHPAGRSSNPRSFRAYASSMAFRSIPGHSHERLEETRHENLLAGCGQDRSPLIPTDEMVTTRSTHRPLPSPQSPVDSHRAPPDPSSPEFGMLPSRLSNVRGSSRRPKNLSPEVLAQIRSIVLFHASISPPSRVSMRFADRRTDWSVSFGTGARSPSFSRSVFLGVLRDDGDFFDCRRFVSSFEGCQDCVPADIAEAAYAV
mmetsp:Transcript_17165/g.36073  ORF Transcript_17165/g.36073 Transcript_17165/m.36073 type:complete len:235 (-) Transcript_17165:93-797(-)